VPHVDSPRRTARAALLKGVIELSGASAVQPHGSENAGAEVSGRRMDRAASIHAAGRARPSARVALLRRNPGRNLSQDQRRTWNLSGGQGVQSETREIQMKVLALSTALVLVGSWALAQDTTTTVTKEQGVLGSKTTVEKKTEPSATSSTTVTTGGSVGCSTETKQKTDEFGDTTTKKKTEC
jgi:hypothetical protein